MELNPERIVNEAVNKIKKKRKVSFLMFERHKRAFFVIDSTFLWYFFFCIKFHYVPRINKLFLRIFFTERHFFFCLKNVRKALSCGIMVDQKLLC